tara:strand:- start:184 stop:636 length:453 start_codon:yes stop_codon:yes gene_type:complete
MKKVNIDTWIQLLGMVGLLGGLIFVGLEMQQNQRIALAAQQTSRVELFSNMVNSLTESGVNYRTLSTTEDEFDPQRNVAHQLLWIFEKDYLQYSLGLMDEGIWQSKLRVMLGNFSRCGNEVYLQRKSSLDEDLVALINAAMPDDCIRKEK